MDDLAKLIASKQQQKKSSQKKKKYVRRGDIEAAKERAEAIAVKKQRVEEIIVEEKKPMVLSSSSDQTAPSFPNTITTTSSSSSSNHSNSKKSSKKKDTLEDLSNELVDEGNDDDDGMKVYKFFRTLLREWKVTLDARPEGIKKTATGRAANDTLSQCLDYIRPLFKLCRKRTVPADILPNLIKIVECCDERDYVRANDAYISLAIGNAAWPIGVTMVGIHERTGRERINSNKQAHVMNNELQRKYLTSVKRLISFHQASNSEHVAPSRKVL